MRKEKDKKDLFQSSSSLDTPGTKPLRFCFWFASLAFSALSSLIDRRKCERKGFSLKISFPHITLSYTNASSLQNKKKKNLHM